MDLMRTMVLLGSLDAERRGFSKTAFRALLCIADPGGATPSELAQRLDLSPGTLTSIAEDLIESGHVIRVAHPTDGRSHVLQVTGSGAAVAAEVLGGLTLTLGSALGPSSTSEIRDLALLLNLTNRLLNQYVPPK
jgi:DNA-binding MarR family transcriptional regulator